MKRIYVLVLIVFALFTAKAQDIAGFELGDNYLQYPNLSLEGSKGNFKKYNYLGNKNIAGYRINAIDLIFSDQRLEAVNIKTNDMNTTSWNQNNFMPMVNYLQGLFGKEDSVSSYNGNVTYTWVKDGYLVIMFYTFNGSLRNDDILVVLASKKYYSNVTNL